MTVLLDANAVIMHGRQFPARARAGVDDGRRIVLPRAVKQELVEDVLAGDDPPANHRESARTIQTLVDEGVLEVRSPDFERYSTVIDEARRRIADDSLPEHAVQADQYIPALVCELAEEGTGDRRQETSGDGPRNRDPSRTGRVRSYSTAALGAPLSHRRRLAVS